MPVKKRAFLPLIYLLVVIAAISVSLALAFLHEEGLELIKLIPTRLKRQTPQIPWLLVPIALVLASGVYTLGKLAKTKDNRIKTRSNRLALFSLAACLVSATTLNLLSFKAQNSSVKYPLKNSGPSSLIERARLDPQRQIRQSRHSLLKLRNKLEGKTIRLPKEIMSEYALRFISGATVAHDSGYNTKISAKEHQQLKSPESNFTALSYDTDRTLWITPEEKNSYRLYQHKKDLIIK